MDGFAAPLYQKHQQIEISRNEGQLAAVANKYAAARRQDELAEPVARHYVNRAICQSANLPILNSASS
jgi:hypothetical protein